VTVTGESGVRAQGGASTMALGEEEAVVSSRRVKLFSPDASVSLDRDAHVRGREVLLNCDDEPRPDAPADPRDPARVPLRLRVADAAMNPLARKHFHVVAGGETAKGETDLLTALRFADEFKFKTTIAGGPDAYKVADQLAAAKIPVLLSPIPTEDIRGGDEVEPVFNVAGSLHKAKVPFALTGDNLLEQVRFAARFGLPQDAALRAATATPASLLGVASRVGAIAPGRDADLVALTGDPFEFTSAVKWTMIDGVIRFKDGE
jgi:imidazolonepropionase-like amidohydrolase